MGEQEMKQQELQAELANKKTSAQEAKLKATEAKKFVADAEKTAGTKEQAADDAKTASAISEQEHQAARSKASVSEAAVAKNKVDLAQAQANALANEDKVQHAEMKKELSNRAYIRASQKAQQIAETARIGKTRKIKWRRQSRKQKRS